jgi:hypothetical protein
MLFARSCFAAGLDMLTAFDLEKGKAVVPLPVCSLSSVFIRMFFPILTTVASTTMTGSTPDK